MDDGFGICPAINDDWDRFISLEEVAAFTNQPATNLTSFLGGLPNDSTRYYAWRASNQVLDVWGGASIRFETLGEPTVDNAGGAGGIGVGVADLNGSFTSPDRGEVTFYYGTSDGGVLPGGWETSRSRRGFS